MEPAGIGNLYLAFEALKKQLAAEGLFDQEIKQKLPVYPRCIGVITSQTGAAVRDIFQVLDRRAPHVDVILKPSRVQGDKAAFDLTEAINDMAAFNAVDVIINGTVDAVINTISGERGTLRDGFEIRRAAVERRIPGFTSLDTARPAVESLSHEHDTYNIKPLREYLQRQRTSSELW